MTYCRPHHPLAYRTKYMRDKAFHKEDINHGNALCKIHNKSAVYKLADKDSQVTCKKCLKKINQASGVIALNCNSIAGFY